MLLLDDIIVFSSSFDECLPRLSGVLRCLSTSGLQLITRKCYFAARQVKGSGHMVSRHGVSPDPDKIRVVAEFSESQNVNALGRFLGLCCYFRRFVRGYTAIAAPLHSLLQDNCVFLWSPDCSAAFYALRHALTNPPVLCHFDPNSNPHRRERTWASCRAGANNVTVFHRVGRRLRQPNIDSTRSQLFNDRTRVPCSGVGCHGIPPVPKYR